MWLWPGGGGGVVFFPGRQLWASRRDQIRYSPGPYLNMSNPKMLN